MYMGKREQSKAEYAVNAPTVAQLREELAREKYRVRFFYVLWNTIFTLVVVAAVTVLVAVLWLPVLEIYGTSMAPTLNEGDIVVSVRVKSFERGDVMGFYYGNKLLVKRVIGVPGDTVEVLEDGTVLVNDEPVDEPYLQDVAFGDCDIDMPCRVPQEEYFVMGDRRSTSMDSRNSAVGCVTQDQISGKIVFRIWPLSRFGTVG